MTVTKWVGYVDDWCYSERKPHAYIVSALFEETPKRWKLVNGQANWDHIQRACDFKSQFNKDHPSHVFDSWQQAYDHLLAKHTAEVEKAKRRLERDIANLQAAIQLEKPCE